MHLDIFRMFVLWSQVAIIVRFISLSACVEDSK